MNKEKDGRSTLFTLSYSNLSLLNTFHALLVHSRSRVHNSYFALTVLQYSPLYNTVRGSSLLIARLDINVQRNGYF